MLEAVTEIDLLRHVEADQVAQQMTIEDNRKAAEEAT
jgi:hypothetical protein